LYRKYIQQLYEKWCSINNYLMIDLCGATDKFPGYINVDKEHGDFKIDLNITPWPIKDNSVGFIRAFDALEHMKDPVATMKEIHRILVPGGMLFSRTPSTDGRGAFQDPTHVSFWNSNSFWYYTREQAKFIGTPVRFQDTYIENLYPSDWHKHHLISYVEAHLTALKGNEESSYCPGVIRI
jgi:SAM-dependent methyltransferase